MTGLSCWLFDRGEGDWFKIWFFLIFEKLLILLVVLLIIAFLFIFDLTIGTRLRGISVI